MCTALISDSALRLFMRSCRFLLLLPPSVKSRASRTGFQFKCFILSIITTLLLLVFDVLTCACGSFWSGRTCRSSPSTASRCPCRGSAVGGLYGPHLLPPWRAARRLLPAGSCAPRWTWWKEPEAA